MPAWLVVAAAAAVLLLGLVAVVVTTRSRRRTDRALTAARADAEVLRAQVEEIQRRLAAPEHTVVRDEREYVITGLGSEEVDGEAAPALPAPVFTDMVLRESVVQLAALAAGLRRALAPEARHRIRFEMGREVKRARKQRRADLREARREWEARQRSTVDPGRPGAEQGAA